MKTFLKLTLAAAALLIVSGSTQASAQKFGYIDIQELVFSMPEIKEVEEKLQTLSTDLQNRLKIMEEEFTKKRTEYERSMSTMTEGVRQLQEEELSRMMNNIQTFSQTAQTDIQNQQEKLLSPLFEKAQVAVNNVAVEQNLTAVFAAGALVYVNKDTMVDVLPLAKKRLGIE